MEYREARSYIDAAWKYAGGDMGLENTEYLLEQLGHPEDQLEFVHIAGTNGKGSVASYIGTVLQCAGYRVGRYVSPTIYSYRERIQINGRYISREEFAGYVEQIRPVVEKMKREEKGCPTPFEMETAISFLFFRDQGCDIVVLECGMGGSTDATNVVRNTKMAVFTSISMDHVGILGNTLEEIAGNKAGIIKPGAIVITGQQTPEVEELLRKFCEEKGNVFGAARPKEAVIREVSLEHQIFRYHGSEITISLAGSHQIENAVLALECVMALKQAGFEATKEEIEEGFLKTRWDGRFTLVCKEPCFIVDGAHNPDAAFKLKQSVQMYFPQERLIFIMGMFQDKDYDKVAEIMAPMADKIFTLTPPDPVRGLPAEKFAETIRRYNERVRACGSLEEAVESAFQAAGKEDVIISFGSLSFAGETIKMVRERKR
ncbi:MAG: bifunctional folylpolyglutamate synthase/dihydrofolate synthase [Ruminococcus sp.]|jgi:dihydrofolate synthase/folylpolyglutamate synthase